MDGQTDQADQIMQGETPRQEIQTQEQEPGGIEPLSGQPGSEAMEPPSENPGSEIPASENPGSLPDTPMADVELATEASEAAEAAGTPSAAKKSRTPRITSLNLPPPRDPSSRRSGAHLPGGLSFPPLDLPDYSDGSGTEVPKGNAGVQWVVQGPESPIFQRWMRTISENLRNRDGAPKTVEQLRAQLATMRKDTSRRAPTVASRPVETFPDSPSASLRSGRSSRNSGGFGAYPPVTSSPLLTTTALNPQLAPPLPAFPAGYTLVLHRRAQYTNPRYRRIPKKPVVEETDETKTETESADGEGEKEEEEEGGPPPGAKIVGWRSDTMLLGHPSGRKIKSAAEFIAHMMWLYVTDHDLKVQQGLPPKLTTGPPAFSEEGEAPAAEPEAPSESIAPDSPAPATDNQNPASETPAKPAQTQRKLPDYRQCPCPSCVPWVTVQEKERVAQLKSMGIVEEDGEEVGSGGSKKRKFFGRKRDEEDEGLDPQAKLARRIKYTVLRRMGLVAADDE